MKYALLKYNSFNLGDEIQSIAAQRFLPRIDYYIDREELSNFKYPEKVKIILNGWFKYIPSKWPPSGNIIPLFSSFHISPEPKKSILGKYFNLINLSNTNNLQNIAHPLFVDYYKKFEPIGCRDLYTARLLNSMGIKTEFTGCLSLTLENKSVKRTDEVVFVDPFGNLPPNNFNQKLWSKIPENIRNSSLKLSHFFVNPNFMQRFKQAGDLLDIYSRAKLVVTSRLHCALPCLAYNTPVIFISTKLRNERLEGLSDLFNVINMEDLNKGLKIDWDKPVLNPDHHIHLKERLLDRCKNFIEP